MHDLSLQDAHVGIVPGVVDGVDTYRSVCERVVGRVSVYDPSAVESVASGSNPPDYLIIEGGPKGLAAVKTAADQTPPHAVLYVDDRPRKVSEAMLSGADVFLHPADRQHFEARLKSLHLGATVPVEPAEGRLGMEPSIEPRAYETLMEQFEDLIYVLDRHARFVRVNEAKAALHDLDPEVMIGQSEFNTFLPETAMEIYRDNLAVIEGHSAVERKPEWIENAHGERIHVTASKHPITDPEGRVIGLIGISRDITALTRQQALIENVRDTIEHLYGMYDHNFRNRTQIQVAIESHMKQAFTAESTGRERLSELGGLFGLDVRPGAEIEGTNTDGRADREEVRTSLEGLANTWAEMHRSFTEARDVETEMVERLTDLVEDFSELFAVVKAGGELTEVDLKRLAKQYADCQVTGESVTITTDQLRTTLLVEQLSAALGPAGRIRLESTEAGVRLHLSKHLTVPALTDQYRDQDLLERSKHLLKVRLVLETLGWDIETVHPDDDTTVLSVDVTAWKRQAGAYT
ncbi:PAS domain-containing protein [Halorhabdus sp. BNX81]|uniref:PAS domain-containing protein n=1 Tax=Halorhabdus sp. BNX81 TaxID=2980181 RepID=UPI0023DD5021|nr:PAS domain-containing protein [Halorhabdus sp. BNX81]WEL22757.1 Signal transduction histidine kinase, contains PAS domain [Halorhabdus sp. BNX81]